MADSSCQMLPVKKKFFRSRNDTSRNCLKTLLKSQKITMFKSTAKLNTSWMMTRRKIFKIREYNLDCYFQDYTDSTILSVQKKTQRVKFLFSGRTCFRLFDADGVNEFY